MEEHKGIVRTVKTHWKDLEDAAEIAVFPLNRIIEEPAYRNALSDGSRIRWATQRKVKGMVQRGWKPLIVRNSEGRVSIFVDSKREVVALTK